jgi:hypothetical protein
MKKKVTISASVSALAALSAVGGVKWLLHGIDHGWALTRSDIER